jgi:hypothetical protein
MRYAEDFDCPKTGSRNWIGPNSGTNDPANGGPGHSGKGWIVEILPFIEQQALHKSIMDALKTPKGKAMFTVRNANGQGIGVPDIRPQLEVQYPWITCPSDPSAKPTNNLFWWPGATIGVTSYKGCIGDHAMTDGVNINTLTPPINGSLPDCHNTAETNGMFGRNTSVRPILLKTVTDGQSNTIMVGENVVSQDYHSGAFFADGDFATCGVPLNTWVADESEDNVVAPPQWFFGRGFKSLHPSGAQFVMGDGSARFVNESVDSAAYLAAATRAGEEAVPLSQ